MRSIFIFLVNVILCVLYLPIIVYVTLTCARITLCSSPYFRFERGTDLIGEGYPVFRGSRVFRGATLY